MMLTEGYSLPWTSAQNTGSEVDLATLVETYSGLLFRVAHSILRSRAEAEDVVQDVFLRVLRHHHKLAAIRDPRVWLVRIAWNLALDRRRSIRPEQMDDLFAHHLTAATTPADQALAEAQSIEAVLQELDRLPRLERQVLLLSAIEELGVQEIAAIMHKSDSAIRALLFRARARLRTRLSNHHSKQGERP